MHHRPCWAMLFLKGSSGPVKFCGSLWSRSLFRGLSGTSKNVEISPMDHGTVPFDRFETSELNEKLQTVLAQMNLVEPTPIQAHTIPLLLNGHDIMASAATGSGKTLMFGLPLLHHRIESDYKALVINPTRELAAQTAKVLTDLASCDKKTLFVNLAVGGEDVNFQRQQLLRHNGNAIVVGTPGRIIQFVDERVLFLRQFQYIVVDEADRCLDLGFEPQLRRIARSLDSERQTVLCSATFPEAVQRIASEFLKPNYYFVAAGRVGGMNPNVKQELVYCRPEHRLTHVQDLVQRHAGDRIIIFSNTKEGCEQLQHKLPNRPLIITGDKSQEARNAAVATFRATPGAVLIATDVASRGLDVPDIGLVIQVDAPKDVDSFVHRSGRTGRAGQSGQCVTFLDARNQNIAKDLVEMLHEVNQPVPAWLYGMAYTSTARRLEEESGLLALRHKQVVLEQDGGEVAANAGEMQFTDQDFRKSAGKGTWGSARNTMYKSFDQDAYGGTDVSAIEAGAVADDSSTSTASLTSLEFSLEDNNVAMPHTRMEPSHSLQEHLQRNNLSLDRPAKSLFQNLLQLPDPLLRYEYLGMFDFATALTLLNRPKHQNEKTDSSMRRLLMVAEKPSIANAIAEALCGPHGPRQKRGISKALPVYEFSADCQLPGDKYPQRSYVTVTSVVGHVFSLAFQDGSAPGTKRQNVDPEEFFDVPVAKQEESTTGKLRVIEHLQALAATSDHLVLWLDCDAEGENIAHEIIGVTRQAMALRRTNQNGSGTNGESAPLRTIHRAFFSAITKKAIQDALQTLGEPNEALSRSVDARQELDLRVGVALTRLLSWRCAGLARKKFSPATKLISYGPCQTPTLSFCIDRANEVKAFQKRPFFQVATKAKAANGKPIDINWICSTPVENNSKRGLQKVEGATYSRDTANEVLKACTAPGASVCVTRIDEKAELIRAPAGLNTVSLLSSASKSMGMSPKQVMNIAEKLYSSGLISYPRTETTRYDPNGFDVQQMLREHSGHEDWGKTASFLLRAKYNKTKSPPSRGKNAGDHPPIYCLKPATREEVGGGAAWKVFDFICRSFIGSLADDLSFMRRTIHMELASNNFSSKDPLQFQVEQVVVENVGFAAACPWVLRDINAERPDEEPLTFIRGMSLPIQSCRVEESATRPPPFLQEHELIEHMDSNRIGTDASMATHVSNIVDRGYVVVCDETGVPLRPPRRPGHARQLARQIGRYLVPTPLGIELMALFQTSETTAELSRPAIRAQMEAEVNLIAQNQLEQRACVVRNLEWFRSRYVELDETLDRKTLDKFASRLKPTKPILTTWQKMGAFEPPVKGNNRQPKQQQQRWQGGGKKSNGTRGGRHSSPGNKGKESNLSDRHPPSNKRKEGNQSERHPPRNKRKEDNPSARPGTVYATKKRHRVR